jgi:cytidylate kinase
MGGLMMSHAPGDASPSLTIAIDGPSASGKGTLARRLGARLGYAVLDTGLLYRAVGKMVLDRGQDPSDPDAAAVAARGLATLATAARLSDLALRSDAVGTAASKVAAYAQVRAALVDFQRAFAARPPPLPDGRRAGGAILDGRDIGTVICPEADVKLYVNANLAERARRRAQELRLSGHAVPKHEVLAAMQERDARDAGRAVAPLHPAPDAFIVDSSHLGPGELLERALAIVRGTIVRRACSI